MAAGLLLMPNFVMVYTQVGVTSLSAFLAPQPPILGEFKFAVGVLLPQNSDCACKKGDRGAVRQGLA
jgi:hypothetical protein